MTSPHPTRDAAFVALALIEARDALRQNERPFGCLVVDEHGVILGKGRGTDWIYDATRHSEIVAIQEACLVRGAQGRTLEGCTLYSTHEPCSMCCGAINHAKISRVVWGSRRKDLPHLFRPTALSVFERLNDTSHPPELVSGVLREDCIRLWDSELLEARLTRIREQALHAVETWALGPDPPNLSDTEFTAMLRSEEERLCREVGIDPSVLEER